MITAGEARALAVPLTADNIERQIRIQAKNNTSMHFKVWELSPEMVKELREQGFLITGGVDEDWFVDWLFGSDPRPPKKTSKTGKEAENSKLFPTE